VAAVAAVFRRVVKEDRVLGQELPLVEEKVDI
jgi:hypothetical protein